MAFGGCERVAAGINLLGAGFRRGEEGSVGLRRGPAVDRHEAQGLAGVAQQFGADFVAADGALDRDRMRALAFSDATAKRRLEALLHPLITAQALAAADAAATRLVVLDVPLLVESGRWRARVARVLVIDCSVQTQIERVLLRPGWSRERIDGALAAQTTREARRAAADAVLLNDGLPLAALANDVRGLAARWGCGTIAPP